MHANAGDVLVAFTDGIIEARNADEHEWGEESLNAAIQSGRSRTPKELIRHIMAQADVYAADTPQHDDMTLIAIRFL